MPDKKPTGIDFFKAGYGDKTIDPAELLEKEDKEASKPEPTVFDLITKGYADKQK